MTRTWKTVFFGAAVVASSVLPALAEVNCEQVRRYAKTGRTEQDIAETMVIDVETVKKCLQGGDAGTTAPTPAAKK